MTGSGDVMTMRWAASRHRKYPRINHHRSLVIRSLSFVPLSSPPPPPIFFILSHFISFFLYPSPLSFLSFSQCVTNKWLNCRGTRLIIELSRKEERKQVSAGLRTRPTNFGRCWTSVITGFRDERRPTISFELTGGNVLGVDGAGCVAVFRDTWSDRSLDFEKFCCSLTSNLSYFEYNILFVYFFEQPSFFLSRADRNCLENSSSNSTRYPIFVDTKFE